MTEDWQAAGFGLYLHWPFCQAKCPYCDFNSHVVGSIDQDRWRRAYLSEIRRAAAETGPRVLSTVFFGGGTPSLMDPDLVAAILDEVRASWPVGNDLEVTLEANPTSTEAARFRGYRAAGVNRVSIGLQALNDPDLRALGRLHTAAEGRAAYDLARDTFERISFDLIYARQNQTPNAWEAELREALGFAADHLSLYQLTIEDGTAFGDRHARGRLKGLPTDDTAADLYDLTQQLCGESGRPAYEVSNHALSGSESRHNLIYWRSGDYVGIGPGAHGRVTLHGRRLATETPLAPGAWLRQVETTGSGESARHALTTEDHAAEFLMMGLRLAEGVDLGRYETAFDIDAISARIDELQREDLLATENGRLFLTSRGRPILNAVLRHLLPDPLPV